MKEISALRGEQVGSFPEQKPTIGQEPCGDRSSWYCVLDKSGAALLEQKRSTTPKAMREVMRIALKTGMHLLRGESGVERVGHEVIVAAQKRHPNESLTC